MLGTVIGGGNALALLQKQLGVLKAKDAKAGQAEARTGAADESTRRAQEALDAVKAANQGRKAQRKAAAKERMERLKKELEALRLASALGDPKAIAHRAKQIARELAVAAREYAAGGGGGGGGVGAAPAADSAGAGGEAKAADAQAQAGEGAAGAAASGDAEAQAAQAQAQADKAAAEKPAGQGTAKDAAKDVAKDALRTPEERRRETAETFQKVAAHMAAKGGEALEDTKFAADLRQMMQQVKSLLAQQRRRAEAMQRDDAEMAAVSRSVRDAEIQMEMGLASGAASLFAPVDVRI